MKTKLVLSLCFLALGLSVFSMNVDWKSGYIIKNEGDTIYGFIGYLSKDLSWKRCLFKVTEDSPTVSYSPFEIESCMFDSGLYYEAKHIDTSTGVKGDYFVRCLFRGIMNLYYVRLIDLNSEFEAYFVENTVDGRMTELVLGIEKFSSSSVVEQRIKKTLEVLLLGNCPQLKDDIRRISVTHGALILLFQKYHDWVCNEKRCVFYTEPQKVKRHLWLIPYAGMLCNKIEYMECYGRGEYYYYKMAPVLGIAGSMNIDRFTNRWMLNIDLEAVLVNMDINRRLTRETMNHHYEFKAVNIVNNISVEYRLLSRLPVLAEAGIFQMGSLPSKNKLRYDSTDYDLDYRKYTLGIVVGVGCVFPLMKEQSIPVHIRYHKSLIGKNYYKRAIDLDMISLTVGYSFKMK